MLTRRQQSIYEYLLAGQAAGEPPPTLDALCDALGLRSRGSMHAQVKALVDAGLVDELLVYLAPKVLGGGLRRGGPSWLGGQGVNRLADAFELDFDPTPQRLGDDLLLRARPRQGRSPVKPKG